MSRYPPFASTSYRDSDGQSHSVSSLSQGRPESTELTDYWENNQVPPPHRFSTINNSNSNAFDPRDSFDHNPFEYQQGPQAFDPYAENPPQPQDDMNSGYDYRNGYHARVGSGDQYDSLPLSGGNRSTVWNEKPRTNGRRSLFIIGGIVLVVIGVIAAVVGVVVSKHHSSSSSSSSSNGSSSSSSSSSTVTPFTKSKAANASSGYFNVVDWKNDNDPSTFVKDPALSNAFWGVAYTPFGSQIPDCGANLEAVIEDMQIIGQITNRLRIYGADCNQSSLVLDAIQRTKVNVSVWLGNYVLPGDDAGYQRQKGEINTAINDFGVNNVEGIIVGNEFMLNYLGQNGGGTDPNSAIGNQGAQILIGYINDTRSSLASMNLPKQLTVGTSDAGAYFNNEVLAAVDFGMANVHPWFANQPIDNASTWTTSFFQSTDVAEADAVPNMPQMYIAETGWPTQSNDTTSGTDGPSIASVPNLQIFIDDFVCPSNQAGIGYFFFEVFDEPWKEQTFGGVEGYWGMFNFNKTLKAPLSMPTCSHS